METQQLLDALTDHMGVYHCSKRRTEKRNSADRKKVIEWFKTLSIKQRQSAFTVVDKSWVAVVVEMQEYLEREGPGSFFLLEDFHSSGLPSLCFRRGRGLLRRLSHTGDVFVENLRLYSSLDGEFDSPVKDGVSSIDCLTVSLEFLENVEGLLEVMDQITYGEFLACQCLYGGSSWGETPWIKNMGYYSLAAFVANRLEISLWSAWVSALGTRQPPKSVSKSVARHTVDMVSSAVSVCTKRQGFQQWCDGLDPILKETALQCALAKVSRSEALRTEVQLDKLTVDDGIVLNDQHLARACLGIQYIVELKLTLTKRLVYSTLFQVHKHTESVVLAVRNVLMKVMKHSVEQELLRHGDEALSVNHKSTNNVQTKNRKNRGRKQKKRTPVDRGADELGSTNTDRTGETNKEPVLQGDQGQDKGWTPGKRKKRKKQERKKSEVTQKKQSELENLTCAVHHGDEKVTEVMHRDTDSQLQNLSPNVKLDITAACVNPVKRQDSSARAPPTTTEPLQLDVSMERPRCPKPYSHFRPQNGEIDTMRSIEVARETFELDQIPYDEEYRKMEEAQQISDYNQIFGGGVMYWNAADYTATCYSRPGSLSSDDSSWARREADLTIVVDDIVGLSAVPYPGLSSGCTSPSSSSSLTLEEVQNGQGLSKLKLEGPVLPPIAVRSSSVKPSKSLKFNGSKLHEARSPRLPRGRREFVRWKRSPSPVLRCVPPAPPPPPPSPVAGVRKRGVIPTVRSGSSSPRHWGVFNWPDGQLKPSTSDSILPTTWRRCIPDTVMHPLTGAVLRERLVSIPSTYGQEHPDVAFSRQTDLLLVNNPNMPSVMARLHEEIEAFCFEVKAEHEKRKPYMDAAVKKVTHALQVLWPRSRTNVYGSSATGLALPNSDVDLVVSLPPVRNLEPIKEAGILEGRNGIKETCLQHAARYLADQEWVKSDSLKIIENTAIPIIILVANCLLDNVSNIQAEGEDSQSPFKQLPWGKQEERHLVHLDISFESSSHTGVLTAELVKELIKQCPAITPLALLLKQFLKDRGLHRPYTGGLSSYCLVLLITRFLQHQCHLGWPSQTQNLGILLMDFLHFFGCVYDPRRMCISIRGVGMYVNRDRLHGIDPLHIEDPLFASNNVGHNCFRILQCTKAFADAYLTLEKELTSVGNESPLLPKILPSISIGHQ